ncbi:MAG: ATP-binding protein [Actinobacteria bacterium]|nr:ATP-binding protein [Actinomycetota bacterium]
MPAEHFDWSLRDKFLNREEELDQLQRWWDGSGRDLITLHGRRRVGKSWLFRAFAHGKPATILVGEAGAHGPQLRQFAGRLESRLGLRPEISTVPELFRILYRLGTREKTLAVIDEFPYLLPAGRRERQEILTAIQAVIEEERDSSKTKFILCGSQISTMEKLTTEESPLHGRLQRLFVAPLGPDECVPFIEAEGPRDWVERYSVGGGMPLYLDELGRGGPLRALLEENVLHRLGSLFEEPPFVLQQELQRPAVYFSLLEEMASGPRALGDLATALGTSSTSLTEYLRTLREMRIIERELPITSRPNASGYRYRLTDGFFRFWFRFVRPFAAELEAGLRPADLWRTEVAPALPEHIAPAFETLCRRWVRGSLGDRASRVGSWWGPALNELRTSGERTTEEIDVVGLGRGRISVVGECKWTARPISVSLLGEIERFKLPALVQSGAKVAKGGPLIVLFSRGGFTDGLKAVAADREDLRLVELADLVPGDRRAGRGAGVP